MANHTLDPSRYDVNRLEKILRNMGLIQTPDPRIVALTGGVSSLIVRVEDGDRSFCAKSALAKLKVEADWQVPVHRNQAEVAWMRTASAIVPEAVPEILGDDPQENVFAMQWLNPDHYPVWKEQLLNGWVSISFAGEVGVVLGKIHARTAQDKTIASTFANNADFEALRLDPYLRATALAHPEVASPLSSLCEAYKQSCQVLVHGDVSPKNILAGPQGPVFLDSECATYGDPAFDLAFCLNHLILKMVHIPASANALATSFGALVQHYLPHVGWEPVADLEARTAALLPALALARVDGKSPVEYLDDAQRDSVRRSALSLIKAPVGQLEEFLATWRKTLT